MQFSIVHVFLRATNPWITAVAELIKAGKFRWEVYEQKDVQLRMYADCAVVIGRGEAKGSGAKWSQHTWVADPNASFSRTLQFTHVYIKRNGKWLLAALHNRPHPPSSDLTAAALEGIPLPNFAHPTHSGIPSTRPSMSL